MSQGPLVFRLVLPLTLAPTMNAYASIPGWKRGKIRAAVDHEIIPAISRYTAWHAGFKSTHELVVKTGKIREVRTGGRRRLVVVTRASASRIDEESCDVAGGKIPIDRLVQAGVLVGDSKKWIERRAAWEPAHRGEGRVVVEVFELDEA